MTHASDQERRQQRKQADRDRKATMRQQREQQAKKRKGEQGCLGSKLTTVSQTQSPYSDSKDV